MFEFCRVVTKVMERSDITLNIEKMKIPQEIIDKLISQAQQDAPNESCGYLLGTSGSEGDMILANWHSHPASPSRPSQEDLRLANDPTIRYAILSLFEGVHLNSFKILNGEIVDKEVHL